VQEPIRLTVVNDGVLGLFTEMWATVDECLQIVIVVLIDIFDLPDVVCNGVVGKQHSQRALITYQTNLTD